MKSLPKSVFHNVTRRFIVPFACAVALGTFMLCWPLRARDLPRDARAIEFVDRNGLMLGTILGRDERHTVALPLARIAPVFLEAAVATEDRRFYFHGALDVRAALRATLASLVRRRLPSGASTLSMQLARMIVPLPPTFVGKVEELAIASRLEAGMSKNEILEAWCNRAPMGSNVYGVEAAARTYFGIDADRLDLAQAALLAALPNDPVRLDPYRRFDALRERQRYVLERMHAAGFIDADRARRAAEAHIGLRPPSGGILAGAHFLFHLAPQVALDRARVRTTIDRPLQEFVEAQMRDVLGVLGDRDVSQAAVVVIDNRSAQVLAYAGSRDYFGDGDLGRNDGVTALRQPGSALKPFLYEFALERRIVRPDTILADVPTTYALPGARIYAPVDYANRFLGPVRVRIALANSLNVPAVRVLSQVGVNEFLRRLRELGFAHLTKPAAFYGLGLTLGGGEVTLEELARAYATAAREGAPTAIVTTLDGSVLPSLPAAAPGERSWALVRDMLSDPHARTASFGIDSILSLPFEAAVKTGTSSDFRDTWTAGFSREYTVAVWVGNFDGHPMRHVSGVTGAAPLWNRIMLHLHERREPLPFAAPPGFARAAICAENGKRPRLERDAAPACTRVLEWFDPDDLRRIARGRASAPSHDYDEWIAHQPASARFGTRILFPHDGERFVYVAGGGPSEELKFEFATARRDRLRVELDGKALAPAGGDYLWSLEPGEHTLVLRTGSARLATSFSVIPAPRLVQRGFTTGSR
jgi:penicillin-binding protein 1C